MIRKWFRERQQAKAEVNIEKESTFNCGRTSDDDDDEDSNKKSQVDNDNNEDEISDPISFEVNVEIGGSKGWPSDASYVLYHKSKSLICVGTENGAIYVYGDGFQYMRPWLTVDTNPVRSIVGAGDVNILVAFDDNSLAILSLPTLDVIDLINGSWIGKNNNLNCVYVDEECDFVFAYIGTSEGVINIFELTTTTIRHCEYTISCRDMGLANNMSISDIQTCPKDEKYLAIGLEGGSPDVGAVVIFDLSKKKSHRQYASAAITSLTWTHTGENLYAGTRTGNVLSLSLDKQLNSTVWVASGQKDDISGDVDDIVFIRRVTWLASQPTTEGTCLFVLLGVSGGENTPLNSVVGLTQISNGKEELGSIFELPSVFGEEIVGFRIVPSIDNDKESVNKNVIPSLLLLTQRFNEDNDNYDRQLKIIRCPVGTINEWSLEIGLLPEPKLATEVLPWSSEVTCVSGLHPSTISTSLSAVLINNPINITSTHVPSLSDELASTNIQPTTINNSQGRRLSQRDFLNFSKSSSPNQYLEDACGWDIVLANGIHDCSKKLAQDIIFVGHEDGMVTIFGVSSARAGVEIGRGNSWIPLRFLHVGTSEITNITTDGDDMGFLLVGDASGFFVLWEIYDKLNGQGLLDFYSDKKKNNIKRAEKKLNLQDLEDNQHNNNNSNNNDEEDNETIENNFHANDVRELFRERLDSKITASLVIGDITTFFIGTEDGRVFASSDMTSASFREIKLSQVHASGAVVSFYYSLFHDGNNKDTPSVYCIFQSGHVAVLRVFNFELLAYNCGYIFDDEDDEAHHNNSTVAVCCVVDGKHKVISKPVINYEDQDILSYLTTIVPFPGPIHSTGVTSSPPVFKKTIFSSSKNVSSPTKPKIIPKSSPNYLIIVRGKNLITIELNNIAIPAKVGSYIFSEVNPKAISIRNLSSKGIISGNIVSYVEEAARAWAKPVPCISCVDVDATLLTFCIKDNLSVCHANLLEGVIDRPVSLQGAYVLPNGNCYLYKNGRVLYSATPKSDTYILPYPLPARATPSSIQLSRALQLLTGRENIVAAKKAAINKRRQSMISMSAAPTDLSKIFCKTKLVVNNKNELLGSFNEDDDEEDEGEVNKKITKVITKQSYAVQAEMNEVKLALDERGQKLKDVAKKMEQFKEGSKTYSQDVKAHNAKLKAKNDRWGLF